MEKEIAIGDFLQYGAYLSGDQSVVFTFVSDCKEAAILFYDARNGAFVEKIVIPNDYRIGDVYSVRICGFDWAHIAYIYKFDSQKVPDAYARLTYGRNTWNTLDASFDYLLSGIITTPFAFSHKSPRIKPNERIFYKLHMRGQTMRSKEKTSIKGTYKALMHTLSDLKDLGVTTLEFFPLYDFEEMCFSNGKSKTNYWGYGNAAYFAPKPSYFTPTAADIGMKELVDYIHEMGMEIVMEFNFDASVREDTILSCIRYWVREYRIDGVHLLGLNCNEKALRNDPLLQDTLLIFEHPTKDEHFDSRADYTRVYAQNDAFLYALRRLHNQTDGNLPAFMRFFLRQQDGENALVYCASPTGFSLLDAYSYDRKHNETNGEDNTDGRDINISKNYGVEGPTRKKSVSIERENRVRMALCLTILSQNNPLLKAGDEIFHTQKGNNNPYCQDNDINWINGRLSAPKEALRSFVKALIAFRKTHPIMTGDMAYRFSDYKKCGVPDVSLHAKEPWVHGIGDQEKIVGVYYSSLYAPESEAVSEDVLLCINFSHEEVAMALPKLKDKKTFYRIMNTATKDGAFTRETIKNASSIRVEAMSVTLLVAKNA